MLDRLQAVLVQQAQMVLLLYTPTLIYVFRALIVLAFVAVLQF